MEMCAFIFECVCVFSGQLKASNVELMEHAVQAMQNLAQQCSDPTAIQDLVTHLFGILGGEKSLKNSKQYVSIRDDAGVAK